MFEKMGMSQCWENVSNECVKLKYDKQVMKGKKENVSVCHHKHRYVCIYFFTTAKAMMGFDFIYIPVKPNIDFSLTSNSFQSVGDINLW